MIKTSIKNLHLLEVLDEETSTIYHGGWQHWYTVWWKRLSGCGPTTVATIVDYIRRSGDSDLSDPAVMKKRDFQQLMEAVWEHVTPGFRGIPSTGALMKGARRYIEAYGVGLTLEEIDIPRNIKQRPVLGTLTEFLDEALACDMPVAFLSLDKGEEPLLDTWHWVTLVALEHEDDGSAVFADVADEGKLLHVDLKKWFETSKRGGGFVRFMRT